MSSSQALFCAGRSSRSILRRAEPAHLHVLEPRSFFCVCFGQSFAWFVEMRGLVPRNLSLVVQANTLASLGYFDDFLVQLQASLTGKFIRGISAGNH